MSSPGGDTASSRCALVTGASRGIGAAIAIALAETGFDVAVAYGSRADEAKDIVRRIDTLGQRGLPIQGDLGDRRALVDVFEQVTATFGRLDVVVNNAGVLERLPRDASLDQAEQIWDRTLAVNGKSVFLSCLKAAEIFRAQEPMSGIRGRIINVGSVGGILATPASPYYGASKAVVHSLTKSFAEGLGPDGILVNAVAPGFVDTEMTAGMQSIAEVVSAQTPLGRWASPQEVAEVVAFLATSGSFITGQVLPVDGGIANVYIYVPKKRG